MVFGFVIVGGGLLCVLSDYMGGVMCMVLWLCISSVLCGRFSVNDVCVLLNVLSLVLIDFGVGLMLSENDSICWCGVVSGCRCVWCCVDLMCVV